jgi:hypothetical protein
VTGVSANNTAIVSPPNAHAVKKESISTDESFAASFAAAAPRAAYILMTPPSGMHAAGGEGKPPRAEHRALGSDSRVGAW